MPALPAFDLPELIEDPFAIFRRDALTGVFQRDPRSRLVRFDFQPDTAPPGRVFQGVAEEVLDGAGDQIRVGHDYERFPRQIFHEFVPFSERTQFANNLHGDGPQITFLEVEPHLARFHPVYIQQGTHHLDQAYQGSLARSDVFTALIRQAA